jgi:periplasmic protein TonB
MPHDLFGDTVVRSPSRTKLRRFLTVLSIAGHAVVISAVVVAQLFAIGPLPTPHRPLAFEEARLIKLMEIEPPPARRPQIAPSQAVSPNLAPIDMPASISPETPLQHVQGPSWGDGVVIVERGAGELDGIVNGERVLPPPPPPPTPQQPIYLHSGMQPPTKIVNVNPIYPQLAQAAHKEGVVILEAVIDARGNVTTVKVLRSIQLLDHAAVEAVRQWRFTPTLLNGEPVPIVMTVTVDFKLQR